MSAGQRGLEAVQAREWEKGIEFLDKALKDSDSPLWFLARSKAHQMLKHLELALEDAEYAYHAAIARGSGDTRRHLIDAQYRRAVILKQLGRPADADCCAKWSMLLAEGRPTNEQDGQETKVDSDGNYTVTKEEVIAEKNKPGNSEDKKGAAYAMSLNSGGKTGYDSQWNSTYVFRIQVIGTLEKLPANHPGRRVTVTKVPLKRAKRVTTASKTDAAKENTPAVSKNLPLTPKFEPPRPKDLKLRSDFYQNNDTVTVTLFVKGMDKMDFKVEITSDKAVIGPIPRQAAPTLPPESDELFSTFKFWGKIKEQESEYHATPNKVELRLKKAVSGKWPSWGEELVGTYEGKGEEHEGSGIHKTSNILPMQRDESAHKPSAYPTSSKSGPKDWDKMDLDDNKEDNNDINAYMQKLYAELPDDRKRAMIKSFTESNGTVLSTDWEDVKKKKVEASPPDGVEVKNWEL